MKVVDLGTGTGCIGLTLKKLIPSLDMTLVDISDNALEMARKNQEKKGLEVSIIKHPISKAIINFGFSLLLH